MEEEFPSDMYLPRGLCVKASCTNDKKLGIFSNITIRTGVKYGPFRGEKKEIVDVLNDEFAFLVRNTSGKPLFFVDAFNIKTANWMRFVKRTELRYNLTIFQKKKNVFFKVSRDIYPNDELLIGIHDKLDQVKGNDEMICDSTNEIYAHHTDLAETPLTISDNTELSTGTKNGVLRYTSTSNEVNVSYGAISLKRSHDGDDYNHTGTAYNSNAQESMIEDDGTDKNILEINNTSSFDCNAKENAVNESLSKIVPQDEPLNKIFKSYVCLKQIEIPEEMKAEFDHVVEPDSTEKLQKTMNLEAENIDTKLTNTCLSLVQSAICINEGNSLDSTDQLTVDKSKSLKEDGVSNTERYYEEPLDLRLCKGVKNKDISDNKNNNSGLKNQGSIFHSKIYDDEMLRNMNETPEAVQKINENLKQGFESANYSTIASQQIARNSHPMNVQTGIMADNKMTAHGPCQSRQDRAINEMRDFSVKRKKPNPCSQYISETNQQKTQNQTKIKKTFRCWICNISYDNYDTYLNHVMVNCRKRVQNSQTISSVSKSFPVTNKFVPVCKSPSNVELHSNVTPIITSVKNYSTDFIPDLDMQCSGTLMRLASLEKLKSSGIIQNNMLQTTISNSSKLVNSYAIGGSRNTPYVTGRPMSTVFPNPHSHRETLTGPLGQNQILIQNVRSLSSGHVNKNINFPPHFIQTQKTSGNLGLGQVSSAVTFNHDLPIKQLQQRNTPSVASFSLDVPQPRPLLRFHPQEEQHFGPLSHKIQPTCLPLLPFPKEPRTVIIPPPEKQIAPWNLQAQFSNGSNSEFIINPQSHLHSKTRQNIKITLPPNKFGGYGNCVPKLLPLGRFPISLNKNLNERRYTM